MYDYSNCPEFEPGSFAWAKQKLEEDEMLSEADLVLVLRHNYDSEQPDWLKDYVIVHLCEQSASHPKPRRPRKYTLHFLGHANRAYEIFLPEEQAREKVRPNKRPKGERKSREPACIRAARRVVTAMVEAGRLKAHIGPERFLNLLSSFRADPDDRGFIARLSELRARA